jgi:hypothetical protein
MTGGFEYAVLLQFAQRFTDRRAADIEPAGISKARMRCQRMS